MAFICCSLFKIIVALAIFSMIWLRCLFLLSTPMSIRVSNQSKLLMWFFFFSNWNHLELSRWLFSIMHATGARTPFHSIFEILVNIFLRFFFPFDTYLQFNSIWREWKPYLWFRLFFNFSPLFAGWFWIIECRSSMETNENCNNFFFAVMSYSKSRQFEWHRIGATLTFRWRFCGISDDRMNKYLLKLQFSPFLRYIRIRNQTSAFGFCWKL